VDSTVMSQSATPPRKLDGRVVKTIETGIQEFPRLKLIFREPTEEQQDTARGTISSRTPPSTSHTKKSAPGTKANPLDLDSVIQSSGNGIQDFISRRTISRVTPPAAKDIGQLLPNASELELDWNTPPSSPVFGARSKVEVVRKRNNQSLSESISRRVSEIESAEIAAAPESLGMGTEGMDDGEGSMLGGMEVEPEIVSAGIITGSAGVGERMITEPASLRRGKRTKVEVLVPYKKLRRELYAVLLSDHAKELRGLQGA